MYSKNKKKEAFKQLNKYSNYFSWACFILPPLLAHWPKLLGSNSTLPSPSSLSLSRTTHQVTPFLSPSPNPSEQRLASGEGSRRRGYRRGTVGDSCGGWRRIEGKLGRSGCRLQCASAGTAWHHGAAWSCSATASWRWRGGGAAAAPAQGQGEVS